MNSKQKIVQKKFLNNESKIISRLHKIYSRALLDTQQAIKEHYDAIQAITDEINTLPPNDPQIPILVSKRNSKVYQKQYQEALKKQVSDILDNMNANQYTNVSDYLEQCYEDGFVGAMYDLHGQGIPIISPINQQALVHAVQTESKISKGLYAKMGVDTDLLKIKIAATVSRSMATGKTYAQCGLALEQQTNIGFNKAVRIARTEGHRIQTTATMDAMIDAKDKGADVVKQWDSTLDDRTRESHRQVDGEIRELDEKFSNGLDYPGVGGSAAEVVNCRCALLQRARWALDDDELQTLKDRAAYYGLDKTTEFEDFKQKYLQAAQQIAQPVAPVKPKKEYLTEKKLQQKIADLDSEIQKYDAKYGDIKNAPASEQTIYADLLQQKADYQTKLDEKITKKEIKKLKKEQILVQDQIDNYQIDTYTGIWKDDVVTSDWASKAASIPKKKIYFQDKLHYATDQAEIDKWQAMLDALDDFDTKGKAYYDLQQQMSTIQRNLTKLQNGGNTAVLDAFTQQRKDAALWFDTQHGGFSAADKYFDPPSKVIHGGATSQEHDGFYTYTSSSGGHNRPLAGFQKPWSKPGSGWEQQFYVGPKKVWIDFEGKGDQIRGLTTLIEKSIYPDDVWLQSGQEFATLEGYLGLPYGTISSMSDADLQQYVGRRTVVYNFISTAVNEGGGSMFNRKPMKFNIYAPSGSQMLYASDVGAFGKGENEMILQRGGTYEITRIYWGNDATDGNRRKLMVDLEIHPEVGYDLFQQDPNEWQGSKKNYHNS